jgi:hypothetical protein
MIKPQTITEELMFVTARLESVVGNKVIGTGTGFFYNHNVKSEPGKHIPLLVTNKHVVQGADKVRLLMHKAKKEENSFTVNGYYTVDLLGSWQEHPDGLDLVAYSIAGVLREVEEKQDSVYKINIVGKNIPTSADEEDFSAVEDILMIGYPNGLWDSTNNLPIFRKGITAAHPAVDFRGAPEFVIDAACFPGSSGSPVFLVNQGAFASKSSKSLKLGTRFFFLGVLYSGPVLNSKGEIVVEEVPTSQKPVAVMKNMLNLGFVIKSKEVVKLAEHIEDIVTKSAPK